jgi:hypothetical protein
MHSCQGAWLRKSLSIVLLLLAACDLTWAKEVPPLPRAKPLSAAHPPPQAPVLEVLPLHDAEAWPSDCALRLAEIARFAHQPSLNGPGQCGASDVVRLEGIIMPNSALVTVVPAATLRCPIAEAVGQWVRNDLGPAMAELDSPPAAITNHGSYDCRGRNNDAGAKISEHGRGNALDLGPIRLANGSVVDLTKRSTPQPIRQRLRDAACHRFSTVLGPGSDAYHADHIHVDLAERAHGYRMCQWDVREPEAVVEVPIPLPKPGGLTLAERKLSTRPAKMAMPARRLRPSVNR